MDLLGCGPARALAGGAEGRTVRRDRLTEPAGFAMLQSGENFFTKDGKSLLGLAGIKKPVSGDRLTNLLKSSAYKKEA